MMATFKKEARSSHLANAHHFQRLESRTGRQLFQAAGFQSLQVAAVTIGRTEKKFWDDLGLNVSSEAISKHLILPVGACSQIPLASGALIGIGAFSHHSCMHFQGSLAILFAEFRALQLAAGNMQ